MLARWDITGGESLPKYPREHWEEAKMAAETGMGQRVAALDVRVAQM